MPEHHSLQDHETRTTRKRREITEAATELFLRNGYSGTSMEEIAAAAGVSKQTMYKQFTSKEALFVDIVSRVVNEAGDVVYTVARELDESKDVEAALRALARRQLELVMTPRVLQLRRLVISEADRFPQLGQAFFDQGPGRTIEAITATFERLAHRGELDLEDPKLAAAHFNWLVMSVPINTVMFLGSGSIPSEEELNRYADEGVSAFLRAYGPR